MNVQRSTRLNDLLALLQGLCVRIFALKGLLKVDTYHRLFDWAGDIWNLTRDASPDLDALETEIRRLAAEIRKVEQSLEKKWLTGIIFSLIALGIGAFVYSTYAALSAPVLMIESEAKDFSFVSVSIWVLSGVAAVVAFFARNQILRGIKYLWNKTGNRRAKAKNWFTAPPWTVKKVLTIMLLGLFGFWLVAGAVIGGALILFSGFGFDTSNFGSTFIKVCLWFAGALAFLALILWMVFGNWNYAGWKRKQVIGLSALVLAILLVVGLMNDWEIYIKSFALEYPAIVLILVGMIIVGLAAKLGSLEQFWKTVMATIIAVVLGTVAIEMFRIGAGTAQNIATWSGPSQTTPKSSTPTRENPKKWIVLAPVGDRETIETPRGWETRMDVMEPEPSELIVYADGVKYHLKPGEPEPVLARVKVWQIQSGEKKPLKVEVKQWKLP